jgi:hypothetical protein
MAASKEIPIKEKIRWQVRGDFHYAFNHPWFGNLASNSVTNANLGILCGFGGRHFRAAADRAGDEDLSFDR